MSDISGMNASGMVPGESIDTEDLHVHMQICNRIAQHLLEGLIASELINSVLITIQCGEGTEETLLEYPLDPHSGPDNIGDSIELHRKDNKVLRCYLRCPSTEAFEHARSSDIISFLPFLYSTAFHQETIATLTALLNEEIDAHYGSKDLLRLERREKSGFQRKLEEQNRRLTEAIVETQEMERRRVARELHDGIGNTLSVIKLLLSSIEKEVDGGHQRRSDDLHRALSLLDSAVEETRQLSRNLTSEMLVEHGLIPTIKEMLERINASNTIHADCQVFGLLRPFPRHFEQNLFRIIQELVHNVLKHAEAKELNIQCIEHENSLIVMVEDDGIGIRESSVHSSTDGMGLKNVETRISILNGTMAIDSSPDRGTVVTLDLPLP